MNYFVSVNFEVDKAFCQKIDAKADYIVRTNAEQEWFDVIVEAENEKAAVALANIYIRNYIMDSAEKTYQKVFKLMTKYFWK